MTRHAYRRHRLAALAALLLLAAPLGACISRETAPYPTDHYFKTGGR